MRHLLIAAILAGIGVQQAPLSGQMVAAVESPKRKSTPPARRVLTANRIQDPSVKIDGRLDELVWQSADVARDFVEFEPVAGRPASQRTEARVLYDETAVYVGMRAYDTAPDSIIGRLSRRDEGSQSDQLVVGFDSYFDRRTAFLFGVNAAGSKMDEIIYDDQSENDSWDPIWEVATTVDSLGWTAELRIPLSQLRFSGARGDAQQLWGVQFQRKVARTNETAFWSPMEREANGIVSFFGELHGISGLRPPRHLEVLPYSVASVTRAPKPKADNPFFHASDTYGAVGADFKYGLTSNLTVSGTLNPDFGQVESDPSVVNLSAYETFLPEKRPFFVEGADIFNFGIGIGDGDLGNESLFYSRRIGRSPQGSTPDAAQFEDYPNATTILGAAKLSGKTGKGWSVGLLDAVTSQEQAPYYTDAGVRGEAVVEPMTNYAVGRLSRDFNAGQTAFGGILTATNRQLTDELSFLRSAAYTGGLSARHRWGGGNYEVSGWLVGSHVRGDTMAINRTQRSAARYFQRPDNDYVTYDPTRTSLTGWAANVQAGKMGGNLQYITIVNVKAPSFEANDLGFQQSADQIFQVWYVGYRRNKPVGPLNRWNIGSNQWNGWNFGGQRTSFGGNVNMGAQLRNYWGLNMGVNRDQEVWSTSSLRGGPAIRSPGTANLWVSMYSDSRMPVRANLSFGGNVEDQTDGNSWYISPYVSVRAGTRADFSFGPSLRHSREDWQYVTRKNVGGENQYIFSQLDQTTLSLTARVNYTFSPTLSLQFYAQPFVSAGEYQDFMRVKAPRAKAYEDRFDRFAAEQVSYTDDTYRVDLNRDGAADLSFGNPDFNFKEMRSNAVLRWEYRPGSTLFLVWSQGRSQEDEFGDFSFKRDTDDLFGSRATNVLLVKFSYWLGL